MASHRAQWQWWCTSSWLTCNTIKEEQLCRWPGHSTRQAILGSSRSGLLWRHEHLIWRTEAWSSVLRPDQQCSTSITKKWPVEWTSWLTAPNSSSPSPSFKQHLDSINIKTTTCTVQMGSITWGATTISAEVLVFSATKYCALGWCCLLWCNFIYTLKCNINNGQTL